MMIIIFFVLIFLVVERLLVFIGSDNLAVDSDRINYSKPLNSGNDEELNVWRFILIL